MNNVFFIYSPQLSNQQYHTFQQQNSLTFLGANRYLQYHIAFFAGKLTACLREQIAQMQCDCAELDALPTLSQAGLLVMDMDSTAIKIECIDEIAKLAGTGETVANITAQAMRGELDFEQSLRQRVATLANAPESILQQVRESLPLMDGFEQMIAILKANHWRIAIASGGFDYFANDLKVRYGLDQAVANQLEIANGKLTGKVLGKVVDAQFKAETLQSLAQHYAIPAQQWVAVGDGANDLPMLHLAQLGVALHAKPKVQAQAKIVVNFGDLTALALLLNAKNLFDKLRGK